MLAKNTLAWHRCLSLLFRWLIENGLTILRNSSASACSAIRVGLNIIPMALVVLAMFVYIRLQEGDLIPDRVQLIAALAILLMPRKQCLSF